MLRNLLEARSHPAVVLAVAQNPGVVPVEAHNHTAADSGTPLRGRTTGPGALAAETSLHPIEAGATAPAPTLQAAESSAAPRGLELPT